MAPSGKIEEINAFSPVQPLVVAGMIDKKDVTLIELYLLKILKLLKIC